MLDNPGLSKLTVVWLTEPGLALSYLIFQQVGNLALRPVAFQQTDDVVSCMRASASALATQNL